MAGIGFELKKLYSERGILKGIRAFLYSFIVTVGPMVLCILLITGMQFLLEYLGEGYLKRQVFVSVIMYAFVFSLILSGATSMYLSRYFADMMYIKNHDEILHGLNTALAFSLTLGGIIGIIFLSRAHLDFLTALLGYSLYMILIVVWTYSVVITMLKNYSKIVGFYFTGVLYGVFVGALLAFMGVHNANFYLLAILMAFFVIAVRLYSYISAVFQSDSSLSLDGIRYLDNYGKLVGVGFFINAGVYIHNILFWFSKDATIVENTFRIAPFYDLPAFYAFLTIIPSMVFFVIFFETNFFDKYSEYYNEIIHGGDLKEMEHAKSNMIRTLFQEYTGVMEIQLFFTILFLLIGRLLLPRLGLSFASVDIFSILALGCYVYAAVYVGTMVLLYFDDTLGALFITGTFFFSNLLLTGLSLNMSDNFRGFGFFVSTVITFVVCYLRLNYYTKNLDYYTYCNQPLLQVRTSGIFTRIADKLERKAKGGGANEH